MSKAYIATPTALKLGTQSLSPTLLSSSTAEGDMADGMDAPETPLHFDGAMYRSLEDEKEDEEEHNKVIPRKLQHIYSSTSS